MSDKSIKEIITAFINLNQAQAVSALQSSVDKRFQMSKTWTSDESESVDVPCIFMRDIEEIKIASTWPCAGELASRFVLIYVPNAYYKQISQQLGKYQARNLIKGVTAHNAKLGYNFMVGTTNKKGFHESATQQFKTSGYVKLLQQAQVFWKGSNLPFTLRIDAALKLYLKDPRDNLQIDRIQPEEVKGVVYNGPRQRSNLNHSVYDDQEPDLDFDDTFSSVSTVFNGPGDFRQTNRVSVDDVEASMMSLPDFIQLILDKVETEAEKRYAMSIVAPFFSESKGSRIPSIMPEPTVTSSAFTDLNFLPVGAATLIFIGSTAWRTPTTVIINDVLPTTLSQTPVATQGNYLSVGINPNGGFITCECSIVNVRLAITLQDITKYLTFSQPSSQDGLYSSVRLVASGSRLYKTSASTTESGVIKGLYSERGTGVVTSINQLINYYQDDHTHVRIYTAGSAGESMGRAGFMVGANYKPTCTSECEDFYPNQRQFLSDTGSNLPGNAIEALQSGPVRFWISVTQNVQVNYRGVVYNLVNGELYLFYLPFMLALETQNPNLIVNLYLDTSSLIRKHLVTYLMEDIAESTTFELQMVQHFEGVPTGESQYLETKRVVMDPAYSTALDVLRRMDFPDFRTGEGLDLNLPEDEYLRGIFGHGYLLNAKNTLHKLGEHIAKRPPIRERVIKFTPKLAYRLMQMMKLPEPIARDVEGKIKEKIEHKLQQLTPQ